MGGRGLEVAGMESCRQNSTWYPYSDGSLSALVVSWAVALVAICVFGSSAAHTIHSMAEGTAAIATTP